MRIATTLLAGAILGTGYLAETLKAQPQAGRAWDYRAEVFGDFGAGEFLNGVRKAKLVKDFGGSVGWRPFRDKGRGFGFEGRLAHMAFDEESNAQNYEHLDSWLLAGDAVYHFRSNSRVQPYVLGGYGVIKASASRQCSTCAWDLDPVTGKKTFLVTGQSEEGADGALLFGGGLKAAVTRHISIRTELLVVRALDHTYTARLVDGTPNLSSGPWGWTRVTIGVGFHF